jgi:hypothetical protein
MSKRCLGNLKNNLGPLRAYLVIVLRKINVG